MYLKTGDNAPDFELWDRVSQPESGFVWLNDSYLRE